MVDAPGDQKRFPRGNLPAFKHSEKSEKGYLSRRSLKKIRSRQIQQADPPDDPEFEVQSMGRNYAVVFSHGTWYDEGDKYDQKRKRLHGQYKQRNQ